MPRGPFWTEKELERLDAHYCHIPAKKLVDAFPRTDGKNRSISAIVSMANRRGLSKSHDRLQEMGRENRMGCKDGDGSAA